MRRCSASETPRNPTKVGAERQVEREAHRSRGAQEVLKLARDVDESLQSERSRDRLPVPDRRTPLLLVQLVDS